MTFLTINIRRAFCVLMTSVCLMLPAQAQDGGEEGAAKPASTYVGLKPAFVVNYGGQGKLRYLKTDISLRVQGINTNTYIRKHMPYVRHTIVSHLTRASAEDMSSMEGRELLRQGLLIAIQELIMQEEGEQQVLDLLFNSFVVQS